MINMFCFKLVGTLSGFYLEDAICGEHVSTAHPSVPPRSWLRCLERSKVATEPQGRWRWPWRRRFWSLELRLEWLGPRCAESNAYPCCLSLDPPIWTPRNWPSCDRLSGHPPLWPTSVRTHPTKWSSKAPENRLRKQCFRQATLRSETILQLLALPNTKKDRKNKVSQFKSVSILIGLNK